jgi:hypothetical protein
MRTQQEDQNAIAAHVRSFFRAFVSSDLGTVHLAGLKHLFLPQAMIIKTCGDRPTVHSFDEFIEPRQKILTDGTLKGFSEGEVSLRTDVFGDIAQSFVLYRKQGDYAGDTFETYGMKSIQFVRLGDTWKIASILWDDERDGVPVPDHLKSKKEN